MLLFCFVVVFCFVCFVFWRGLFVCLVGWLVGWLGFFLGGFSVVFRLLFLFCFLFFHFYQAKCLNLRMMMHNLLLGYFYL